MIKSLALRARTPRTLQWNVTLTTCSTLRASPQSLSTCPDRTTWLQIFVLRSCQGTLLLKHRLVLSRHVHTRIGVLHLERVVHTETQKMHQTTFLSQGKPITHKYISLVAGYVLHGNGRWCANQPSCGEVL